MPRDICITFHTSNLPSLAGRRTAACSRTRLGGTHPYIRTRLACRACGQPECGRPTRRTKGGLVQPTWPPGWPSSQHPPYPRPLMQFRPIYIGIRRVDTFRRTETHHAGGQDVATVEGAQEEHAQPEQYAVVGVAEVVDAEAWFAAGRERGCTSGDMAPRAGWRLVTGWAGIDLLQDQDRLGGRPRCSRSGGPGVAGTRCDTRRTRSASWPAC